MSLTEEQVKTLTGLSDSEVSEQLKKSGYNELQSAKKRTLFNIIFEVLKEPMFLLLLICGGLYVILGDIKEALMLLGFVFVIIGITVYQEGKTEKALDALRDLSSPRAFVIRNSEKKRIPGREVVCGDIIILAEGDRIPADGVLLWGINLSVDESILTGESVPVRKLSGSQKDSMQRPGGDDLSSLYSGTLVVQGQGVFIVKSTGINTEMGKIGTAISEQKTESTPLQKEIKKLVTFIFSFAVIICLILIIYYSLTHKGGLLNGILFGITLAMAMLPEEFPVVLTVFLALGAWRISQKKVLTRRISAVETLGASTVLCVDKTGTLTQNKMSISKLFLLDKHFDIVKNKNIPLPEAYHELMEYSLLASQKDPFDPMEKALKDLGYEKLSNTEHIHDNWTLIQEYSLSIELLALSHVWKSPEGKDYIVAAKGAPESIGDLCHLNNDEINRVKQIVNEMASQGLRVIGVAKAKFKKENLPPEQHDFQFKFVGLIGLNDPIRQGVTKAIKECYSAGIRIVMITGDYPITAKCIAQDIGLRNPDNILTGIELAELNSEVLREKVKDINIFARIIPEQKLKIVNALKMNNEIVAMTGDGVNDAPALKSAHIGIAMGERGTDVAREASSLVLVNDNFISIVDAVKMGRRIFDNLKKAMAYIISVHIPIMGLSFIPIILKWEEMILLPVHIVFLELLIDPACSVVFEAEEAESDIMVRNPRYISKSMLGKRIVFLTLLQGIMSFLLSFGVFKISIFIGQQFSEARTLAFITLIISNIFLILTNRNWTETIFTSMRTKNAALIWVVAGALVFLGIIIYVPFFRELFHFKFMHFLDLITCMIAGFVTVLWFELLKVIAKKKNLNLLE